MAYSKFTDLKKIIQTFGLQAERTMLFPDKPKMIEPSTWLKESMSIAIEVLGIDSEKERSERLVHPILAEIARINKGEITVYSGHELNVDKSLGLNGECDYLLSLGKKVIQFIDTPIFSVVEAKRQDMELGISQSLAQLIGAQRYNLNDGKNISVLYGAATDGYKWQFIRLTDKTISIDANIYLLNDLPLLLGVLQYAFDDCKKFGIQ
jgi:hypothetical protein